MDHVSAQDVDERMINYYVILIIMTAFERRTSRSSCSYCYCCYVILIIMIAFE